MKRICAMLLISTLLISSGCSSASQFAVQNMATVWEEVSATPEITVEQVLYEYNSSRKAVAAHLDEDDIYAPLTVTCRACQVDDSYIIFPKVDGDAGEKINDTVCSAIEQRAEALGINVFCDYKVEYNRNGIFSIRMFLYDMYAENDGYVECMPFTFNGETGELLRISDLFHSENQNWRGKIPDIITAQAADSEMVLLSDILPIADDRPFYITEEAVVIMYDLYEISTYSAGEPEFEIAVTELVECIDDSSMLNVMLAASEKTAMDHQPEEDTAMDDTSDATEEPAEENQPTDDAMEAYSEAPMAEENAEGKETEQVDAEPFTEEDA